MELVCGLKSCSIDPIPVCYAMEYSELDLRKKMSYCAVFPTMLKELEQEGGEDLDKTIISR